MEKKVIIELTVEVERPDDRSVEECAVFDI